MFGKPYFLLTLLQAVVSEEWSAYRPLTVTAQRGLCARIPCRYRYPSDLAGKSRAGVWFNSWERNQQAPIAFHSSGSNHILQKFRHRTRLSGDLRAGDCSLVIDNITQEDEGPYLFRVEFDSKQSYSYLPATQLQVSDFTDKPSILPAEMVAGKPVNIKCTFNTTCNGTAPTLTWDPPTDAPTSVSSSVTQCGDTWTYTSVLTLTPELKHHRQTLTCRVIYPSVSSERTLTLTVETKPEISPESGCTRVPGGITCVCAARSNPPGELTWHLPRANLSGNQTHGRFQTWEVSDGQLVTGSLTLTWGVGEEEEETTARCTVRNRQGEVTFKVYLWERAKPEISPESGCTRVPGGITCVCAARSNPPGELTWHLPRANLSGNQTHGRFQTWEVSDGQLVTGSLTLTWGVGEEEEETTARCTVRNRQGEVTFKVYLWERGGDSSDWKTWLFTSGIIFNAALTGFLIYKCIQKREVVTGTSATQDTTVSYSQRTAMDQDADRGAVTPAPHGVPKLQGGADLARRQRTKCEDPLYCNAQELSTRGTDEATEYAEIRFH